MADDLIERLRDGVCYVGSHPTFDEAEANSEVMHAAAAELERVRRERDNYRFSPQGDNHHNALKCPYCNPGLIDYADALASKDKALEEMRAELERVKAALEPFAAACPKLFNDWCPDETPAWFVDDEDGEPGWEKPSSVTVGDFRAAARAQAEGETP